MFPMDTLPVYYSMKALHLASIPVGFHGILRQMSLRRGTKKHPFRVQQQKIPLPCPPKGVPVRFIFVSAVAYSATCRMQTAT